MDDFPALPPIRYTTLRQQIRSGDILLCAGNSAFSALIQRATGSIFSHVGFILRLDAIDRIMILESVESIGVRAIPLSNYVFDYNATGKGYPGKMLIARHTDFRADNIIHLSQSATRLLGYPYNTKEIIDIAMRIGLGTVGIHPAAAEQSGQRAFICSEYAAMCFHSVGIQLDFDPRGFIAPADFARCPQVQPVGMIDPAEVPAYEKNRKKILPPLSRHPKETGKKIVSEEDTTVTA